MLTCRQIYLQAAGYYYALNTLVLRFQDFPDFVRDIGPINLERVSMLRCLILPMSPTSEVLRLVLRLAEMTGLKELQLRLPKLNYGDGEYTQRFANLRTVCQFYNHFKKLTSTGQLRKCDKA